MNRGALIIGSGTAALQAALDLADSGLLVHLVESSPFLGNNGASAIPQHLLNTRLLEVSKHPNVRVWTNSRVNRTEGKAGNFQIELRRHPRYVDLSKCTACGDCIEVCPVTVPNAGHKAIYLDGQPECAAVEKLDKPPCANACPGGIHVQGYVALIRQERFQEAIDLIRDAIPFPGICGRVCTHPCEINCRRAEVDKPVAIRLLKRFLADWEWDNRTSDPKPKQERPAPKPQKVAVVGAGPGGMAVADGMARLGYQVTVFEKLPVIGGMMAIGIPEYRLPRDIISREYKHIQDLGVDIRLNTAIGPNGDHTLDDLFSMGYQAVCLAVGAQNGQTLQVPGKDLPGVVQGIELLKTISLSQQLDDPKNKADLEHLLRRGPSTRVVVLGGGNTAMDVSRSLKRFGIKDVRVLYRRTRKEMPALPEEIEEAEQEGVVIEYLTSPARIIGDTESGVTGLECIRMELGEKDSSGRQRPVPIADSEFLVDVDLVILAIGQTPDLSFLGEEDGIAVTRSERINVSDTSYMTSRQGVFAVGDAVTRDRMAVIEAIGMGKESVTAMDAFIQGQQTNEVVVDAGQAPISLREMTEDELVPKPPIPAPVIPMKQRLTSYTEVELGFGAEQAVAEASRCLVCGPCSECMACVHVCKPGAIVHDQDETFTELEIGSIIYADDPARFADLTMLKKKDVYQTLPEDAVQGSAAAASVMLDLFVERKLTQDRSDLSLMESPPRFGVFVCQCGGEISQVVDTQAVSDIAADWNDVIHTQVLPHACSPEAAQIIENAVQQYDLNKVVLAGCACCSIDQVCYSCTYQRIRVKDNLGVFASPQYLTEHLTKPDAINRKQALFEFVNIREQCAWAHPDDPQAATAKALSLIAAAVAGARKASAKPQVIPTLERSVLVLGSGAVALTFQETLKNQDIAVRHLESVPDHIQRTGGQYQAAHNGNVWRASVLALAPKNKKEGKQLLSSVGLDVNTSKTDPVWGGLDTLRPGVFYCDPGNKTKSTGAAAAARIAAWLGNKSNWAASTSAVVNPNRCRACGTCVEICEFCAIEITGDESQRSAWIDPIICTGCGVCAAHCPSGAITTRFSNDEQLTAMLNAALASGGGDNDAS